MLNEKGHWIVETVEDNGVWVSDSLFYCLSSNHRIGLKWKYWNFGLDTIVGKSKFDIEHLLWISTVARHSILSDKVSNQIAWNQHLESILVLSFYNRVFTLYSDVTINVMDSVGKFYFLHFVLMDKFTKELLT